MSGSPQVWIVAARGGWPDQITALDDPVANIEWSPDGDGSHCRIAADGQAFGAGSNIAARSRRRVRASPLTGV